MRHLTHIVKEEKGTALVLVALGMTVFMGFAALVIDVGALYVQRQRLVNAIDAAALAAAQELALTPENAESVAFDYVERNGINPNDVNIVVDGNQIEITAAEVKDTFFAKALGFETASLRAESSAKVGSLGSIVGVVPLAIEEQDLIFGQEYTLKVGGGEAQNAWFGPLKLGGNGASVFEYNLKRGFGNTLKIGDIVPIETGNVSGSTKDGIEYRLNECTHYPKCGPSQFYKDCPAVVYLPIVRLLSSGAGTNQSVEIRGFASLVLSNVPGNGTQSEVRGYFIRRLAVGDLAEAGEDYGTKTVKLIN